MQLRPVLLAAFATVFVACACEPEPVPPEEIPDAGTELPPADGGSPDGGNLDGGPVDGGPADAGPADAGQPIVCDGEVPMLVPGATVSGLTVARSSGYAPRGNATTCGDAAGPEWIYRFHLDHKADLIFEATTSFDGVVYARASCDNTGVLPDAGLTPLEDAHCSDSAFRGAKETVEWQDASPGDYYFFVDGLAAKDHGAFTAKLVIRELSGLGGPCGTAGARCGQGLLCDASSRCATIETVCGAGAKGTVTLGAKQIGSTLASADTLQCGGGGAGKDVFYVLTADADGGTYNINVKSSDHLVYAYQTPNCRSSEEATTCTGGTTKEENFDLTLLGGQRTYLVIDGEAGENGAYELTVGRVVALATGDACDQTNSQLLRCPVSDYCTGASQCAPILVEQSDPHGDPSTAQALDGRAPKVTGAIDLPGEVDFYSFAVLGGATITAETQDGFNNTCDSLTLESHLQIIGPNGTTLVAENHGGGVGFCALASAQAGAGGTYFIAVDASPANPTATFDYTLRVQVSGP